jgi:hypothetical protein
VAAQPVGAMAGVRPLFALHPRAGLGAENVVATAHGAGPRSSELDGSK